MRRFLVRLRPVSLFVLLLLSSLGLSLTPFLSSPAYATSDWDDTVTNTEQLPLFNTAVDGAPYNCAEQEWNTSWSNIFSGDQDGTASNGHGYHWDTALYTDYFPDVNDAWNGKMYWGVSSLVYNSGDEKNILIWMTNSPDSSASFTGSPTPGYNALTVDDGTGSLYWVAGYMNDDCDLNLYTHETTQHQTDIAHPLLSGSQRLPLFANIPITYPSGYEGEEVPDSVVVEGENYHNFEIQANVSSYTVEYTITMDTVDEGIDYFTMDFGDGDGEHDFASYDGNPNVRYYSNDGYDISCSTINDHQVCSVQFLYLYPEDSDLDLEYEGCAVGYTLEGHDRAHCVTFKIGTAGTTTYIGSTNIDDVTSPEDQIICGDWDIWCQVTQFIANLFNPNDTNIATIISDFTTDDHGLAGIITAPIDAVNSLTSQSCSSVTVPLPFVASNLSLPCFYSIYEDNFGDFFTMYQLIATGVISYYIIVNLLATVKGFKDPEESRIEVLKL